MLITAFEPFGEDDSNSSEEVLNAVANVGGLLDDSDATLILPVDRISAVDRLIEYHQKARPNIVVCLGQANDRSEITIEKLAINCCDFRIPDNSGVQPVDEPVVMGGPAAYFSTLSVSSLVKELKQKNVPAAVSYSAGTYVCNAVLYGLLHHVKINALPTQVGFVHLPPTPEQVTEERPNCLAIDIQIRAVSEIIRLLRANF